MKREISAGGVVVRKKARSWEVLLISDMNKQWTFPKGLVEKGEEMIDGAKREIGEEVGVYDVTYMGAFPPIHYMYRRNGLINKTVFYFLFSSKGSERLIPQKEEGITAAQWVPLSKATTLIGYPQTGKTILTAVDNALSQKKKHL